MATIGLDSLYYADVTEQNGEEVFGNPVQYKGAIKLSIDIENSTAELEADDGIYDSVEEFIKGNITLEMADLPATHEAALCGAESPGNNATISSAEDAPNYKAIGFRARKANGRYRYYWIYKCKFGQPKVEAQTKGSNITFTTTTLTGTVYAMKKVNAYGKHSWRTRKDEAANASPGSLADNWFEAVQDPNPTIRGLTITSTAGSSAGKTRIAIAMGGQEYQPVSGESFRFKLGSTATTVAWGDDLSSWELMYNSTEITATNGQKITVAVVNSSNKATAAGSTTVVTA